MTRIKYGGLIYLAINKEDWEFAGGETNPDLLRLPNRRAGSRGYRYFKLRDGVQVIPEAAPAESETEAALRKWREDGVLP